MSGRGDAVIRQLDDSKGNIEDIKSNEKKNYAACIDSTNSTSDIREGHSDETMFQEFVSSCNTFSFPISPFQPPLAF